MEELVAEEIVVGAVLNESCTEVLEKLLVISIVVVFVRGVLGGEGVDCYVTINH